MSHTLWMLLQIQWTLIYERQTIECFNRRSVSTKNKQKVTLLRKSKRSQHPLLVFHDENIIQSEPQKHLGSIILNCKSKLNEHLKLMISKTGKTIGFLCKRQYMLQRKTYITILKAIARAPLWWCHIWISILKSFHEKPESIMLLSL